jgi:hypothetical protein
MKNLAYTITVALVLAATPVLAATDEAPAPMTADAPAKGHGNPQDDHSKIQALAVTPEEAVTALETGLADLLPKVEAKAAEDVIKGSFALMSPVKTLQAAQPNERQAAALKQLDQQLDAAKHAAEDANFEKAGSALVKAQSALKLYKAM